jgi:hypothetical protein
VKTTTEWIRTHALFRAGVAQQFTIEQVRTHVEERLSRAFHLIRAKCAIGLLQYESNRGRSPNYLGWLEQSLEKYKRTKNIDDVLDVAFYAIAESENPSFEGAFYNSEDSAKGGVEL